MKENALEDLKRARPLRMGAWIAIWCVVVGSARADLIYFRGGGSVQAPAAPRDDSIVIDLAGEEYVFTSEDLRARIPGFDPAGEWGARLARARDGGVDSRFAAAWWALENGLTDEAAAEVRAIHQADPLHEPSARMAAILSRLDAPRADPDVADFRKALGATLRAAHAPHVLLLHQHSDAEAAARAALLERVVVAYYLTFAGAGVELRVPETRVVFAWFGDRADYLAFLNAQEAGVFASTRGYYHPTWKAVVSFDARTVDTDIREREILTARRDEVDRLRATIERMPPGARARLTFADERPRTVGKAAGAALVARWDREVRRRELLQVERRIAMDDGIAAHETVHLLAAASGLQPRPGAFPLWLQEGLAMQFEVVRGGRWAGIGRPHDIRLTDWRNIKPPPSLEPLIHDRGFGRGYQRDPYTQAWALVYFLRARRSGQFVAFLDLLRNPSPTTDEHPSAVGLQVDAFRRAFGENLDRLEREWHEFLDLAATPLEAHDPDGLWKSRESSSRRP